jgi:Spy/CpxP family protein refolding chaperone
MSTRTILAILLAASLAGNVSFLLTSFLRQPFRNAGVIERLSLTTDQASRVEEVARTFRDDRVKAHRRMSDLRKVLADEFQKDQPDRPRMLSAAAEMARVQTGMRPRLVDYLLALHAVLTPEQRGSLAEAMRAAGESGETCPEAMPWLRASKGGKRW